MDVRLDKTSEGRRWRNEETRVNLPVYLFAYVWRWLDCVVSLGRRAVNISLTLESITDG